VEADLRRTTGRSWSCSVDGQYVLAVTDGVQTVRVLLESEVEDEEWFVRDGSSAADLDAGLDADADELLASEVVEVLNSLGVAWPLCREHRGTMGACEGWWYCNGEPYHDVAGVGALEQGQVTPPAA
jgi:hypothetical protein